MIHIKQALATVVLISMLGVVGGCGKKDDASAVKITGGKVETLAQVGAQKITTSDLEQALANLPESYRAVAMSAKGKRQILDNLIKKSLLIQEAQERGYQKSEVVQNRIKEFQTQSVDRLKEQIADLQKRLRTLDNQVYENVLLTELNDHLKQDATRLQQVEDDEVQSYYEDYVAKLKMLNPAARAPELATVSDKIRAILVEETLLKELEAKYKVSVEEELFRRRYTGEKDDVVIQDTSGR